MRFFHMAKWAYDAFMAQRFKKHGKPQTTRIALVLVLQGFHIGIGRIGAITDPTYWILKGYDVAGVRK